MLDKFLREVVVAIAGKQSEDIANLLNSKKHVNEFIIAKKMDITINQTRNILYRISDYGLVSSIRKKDKKKGWYTYFWKIEILKSLEFLQELLKKRIEQLNNQIRSRETKRFYFCERCNIELGEEAALLHDFTCSECGEIFSLKDNSGVLRALKKDLNRCLKELENVEKEIRIEKEKLEKIRIKEMKKTAKKKPARKTSKKKSKTSTTAKKSIGRKKTTKKKLAKKTIKKKSVKKSAKKRIAKKKPSKKKITKKPAKKKTTRKVVKKPISRKKKVIKKKPVKKKPLKKRIIKKSKKKSRTSATAKKKLIGWKR